MTRIVANLAEWGLRLAGDGRIHSLARACWGIPTQQDVGLAGRIGDSSEKSLGNSVVGLHIMTFRSEWNDGMVRY